MLVRWHGLNRSELETLKLVRCSRAAGERMDRVQIDISGPNAMGFDVSEYQEQAELAREGLLLLADEPAERKTLLLEWAAFADFLASRLPILEQAWLARRAELVTTGELPPAAETRDGKKP